MDAVVDDIHVSQVVDLTAPETVAEDEEDKEGTLPLYVLSPFSSFSKEEVSTPFVTAFRIRSLVHAHRIYDASASPSTAVE